MIDMRRGSLVFGMALAVSASAAMAGASGAFSFKLTRIDESEVFFQREGANSWTKTSYACDGCAFLVSDEGIRGPAGAETGSGVIVQLREGGRSLAMTCRAPGCSIKTGTGATANDQKKLARGESIVVPAKPPIAISVTP